MQQDFGILLNLAYGQFKTKLHASLSAAGFDDIGSSYGYVFRLLADGPENLRQVADSLGMSSQGALKIINAMVEGGYVVRSDDPDDGRIKLLTLTKRAQQAMAQARRFHTEFERDLAKRLGADQAAAARAVLEDLARSAGTTRPKAA